ncbi:MAG TPA: peptidoglycan-binding domain-containing protein, partial [Legionellaceae bacterium]|nr:peptidoglycan-binding domain-containing protein [Legionellaceae bacterium]
MKKTLLLITLLINAIFVTAQVSRFQRIAIAATEFELNAANATQVLSSFCTDFDRDSPPLKAMNFSYVQMDEKCVYIGNHEPITMQQAMDEKYIALEVDGFSHVKIKDLKKTDEPIKISIGNNVVFGDVPGDNKRLVLPPKATQESDQATNQIHYWEKQAEMRSLIDLNYLPEKEINNADAQVAAIKKFQTDNGIQAVGVLGPATKENLYANSTIKKFLPEESSALTTTEAIKEFQEKYDLPVTGKFDLETKIELTKLESINNKINGHEPLFNFYKNKLEGQILQRVSLYLTESTLTTKDAEFAYVLFPEKDDYEFLKIKMKKNGDGFIINEKHNASLSDVQFFDNSFQSQIAELSSNDAEILHFGVVSDGTFKLQIGKTNTNIAATET